ncbi:MAG: hypothetical protein Tsb0034_14010 [Ekhidna sp.]
MSTFDIVLLILLGAGAVKGYLNGFIVEVVSFLAFFIGLFLALELTVPVSKSFFGDSNWFELASIIVFILLFILLSMAIKAGAKMLKKAIDITVFGTLDNMVGALSGALKWAFIVSVVFWVFESVGIDIQERYAYDSFIFPYIVGIGPVVFGALSDLIPLFQDLIDAMEKMSRPESTRMT